MVAFRGTSDFGDVLTDIAAPRRSKSVKRLLIEFSVLLMRELELREILAGQRKLFKPQTSVSEVLQL